MNIKVKLKKNQNLSDEQNQNADAFIDKYGVIVLEYERDTDAEENDNIDYQVYKNGQLLHKGTDILFRVEDDRLNLIANIIRAYRLPRPTSEEATWIYSTMKSLFYFIETKD